MKLVRVLSLLTLIVVLVLPLPATAATSQDVTVVATPNWSAGLQSFTMIMVNENQLDFSWTFGADYDTIMIRTGPELYETILQKSYARTMDFTGRVMRNFVYVDPEDIQSDESLHELVTLTVNFASSLPRKTKSPEDES